MACSKLVFWSALCLLCFALLCIGSGAGTCNPRRLSDHSRALQQARDPLRPAEKTQQQLHACAFGLVSAATAFVMYAAADPPSLRLYSGKKKTGQLQYG
jgi:hypothetical protein